MTEGNQSAEITDHPVWEVGQPVHLAADGGPWTISRISRDEVRYVHLIRTTPSGQTDWRRIRDDVLRRHQEAIERRTDRSDVKATVGAQVRALRVERDLTQHELAAMTSVHWTMIGHIEAGTKNASLDLLDEVAVALDVHPRDLFGSP